MKFSEFEFHKSTAETVENCYLYRRSEIIHKFFTLSNYTVYQRSGIIAYFRLHSFIRLLNRAEAGTLITQDQPFLSLYRRRENILN